MSNKSLSNEQDSSFLKETLGATVLGQTTEGGGFYPSNASVQDALGAAFGDGESHVLGQD